MSNPIANRTYQTADQAVQLINDARKRGQTLVVTKDGDIAIKRSTANPVVLWIKGMFAGGIRTAAKEESVLKAILATKMKVDIVKASVHASETLRTLLDDINKISNNRPLNDLCTEWVAIKNKVELNNRHRSDELLFIKEQELQMNVLDQAANSVNPDTDDVAPDTLKAGVAPPSKASEDPMHDMTNGAWPHEVMEKADTHDAASNVHTSVEQNDSVAPSEAEIRRWIDGVNQALPAAMPEITHPGQTVRCTLSVPMSEHLKIFCGWREWKTHTKSPNDSKPDPFVGLSEQFRKDAQRLTYVFESDDFPIECERDAESVVMAFKQAVGKHPIRQLILSHLLDQGVMLEMLEALMNAHPRNDGRGFVLGGGGDASDSRRQVFHMTTHKNGDVDIEYLVMKKCTTLAGLDDHFIEINTSSAFDGPVSQANAGTVQSMKIRLLNSDLNRGELLPQILKPLQISLQVELPETYPDK